MLSDARKGCQTFRPVIPADGVDGVGAAFARLAKCGKRGQMGRPALWTRWLGSGKKAARSWREEPGST